MKVTLAIFILLQTIKGGKNSTQCVISNNESTTRIFGVRKTTRKSKNNKPLSGDTYLEKFESICEAIYTGKGLRGMKLFDKHLFQAGIGEDIMSQQECDFVVEQAEEYAGQVKF